MASCGTSQKGRSKRWEFSDLNYILGDYAPIRLFDEGLEGEMVQTVITKHYPPLTPYQEVLSRPQL